jgi:sugar phosphate isomerase/epimerase
MPKAAMHEITTFKWSFEEDVDGFAAAGYEAIALVNAPRFKQKSYGVSAADARERLRSAGLSVSTIASAAMFELDDERKPVPQLERAHQLVDFAKEVDAACLQVVFGPLPSAGVDAGIELGRNLLGELLPYAEREGVRLGIEPLHPMSATDFSIVNSLRTAQDIVEGFGSPNLGIVLDTYHVWWEAELPALIRASAGNLFGVHVADWRLPTRSRFDRELPGRGVAGVASIVAAIEAAGYTGIWDIEILSEDYWNSDYPTLLKEARAAFESLWD